MAKETNREKALVALINTKSIAAAARECGLAERTLHRYLADADFRKEYRSARVAVVEVAISRMQSCLADACDTLERNLNCENAAVETRTAQIIYDNSLRGVELVDVLQRLEALENANNN